MAKPDTVYEIIKAEINYKLRQEKGKLDFSLNKFKADCWQRASEMLAFPATESQTKVMEDRVETAMYELGIIAGDRNNWTK